MAATRVPERLSWVLQTLAVEPNDRLLEIGCGRGIAVALICEKLGGGRIIAIDRSATMIKYAEQRNAANIDSGKAVFLTTPLDAADLVSERFDKIFAVNVNLFWVRSAVRETELVKRVLTPEGTLYLFYERPRGANVREVGDRVAAFLMEQGFPTVTLTRATRPSVSLLCVAARR